MRIRVFLTDDGSTDGTVDAVKALFPETTIVLGDGTLFWAKGMNQSWHMAAHGSPDYYLWLNDDVQLAPDGLKGLLGSAESHASAIIVGTCVSPSTGLRTYGGQQRLGGHPAKLAPVEVSPSCVTVDTFEGNIVLIPKLVFDSLGYMHPYSHAMGDTDYGYRACASGFKVILSPGVTGYCEGNARSGVLVDGSLPLCLRVRHLYSNKGLPLRDWIYFLSHHGRWWWPLLIFSPLFRTLFMVRRARAA